MINVPCYYAVFNDDDDDEDDDDAMGKRRMIEMIQFFYQILMLKSKRHTLTHIGLYCFSTLICI